MILETSGNLKQIYEGSSGTF